MKVGHFISTKNPSIVNSFRYEKRLVNNKKKERPRASQSFIGKNNIRKIKKIK
jgi:hypothetical protein